MSKIEQLIDEIEEYIEGCKFQPLSTTKILVNKEELEELLIELRLRVPEEIKQCQKIISNQEAIIAEARSQADTMVTKATAQTNELVNEHEIMQKAYASANEIINQANLQAQNIVDKAVEDANDIRQNSIQYTNDMLMRLESIIGYAIEEYRSKYDGLMTALQSNFEIVSSNRKELSGSIATGAENQPAE